MRVLFPPHIDKNTFGKEHAIQLLNAKIGHSLALDSPVVHTVYTESKWSRLWSDHYPHRRYDILQFVVNKAAAQIEHLQKCGAIVAGFYMDRSEVWSNDGNVTYACVNIQIKLARCPIKEEHSNCHHMPPAMRRALMQIAQPAVA